MSSYRPRFLKLLHTTLKYEYELNINLNATVVRMQL